MSSGVRSLASSDSRMTSLKRRTAWVNTAPPVHRGLRPPVVDLLLRHDRVGRGPVDLAVQLVQDRAVLVEVVGDEPAPRARIDGLEHHGPGAVREEHGHVAAPVRVLEHRRQPLGADDEHLPVAADPDEGVGDGQRVDEPRAPLLEVQHRRRSEAELRRHDSPRVGVRVLRYGRGDDHEVDVVDLEPGVLEGHLGRLAPEVRGRQVRVDVPVDAAIVDLAHVRGLVGRLGELLQESERARQHSAFFDPGALGDPLVGSGEAAREQVVVHHAVGHRHTRSDDLRLVHGCLSRSEGYSRRQPTTRSRKLSRIRNPFCGGNLRSDPPIRR